jgi:peptide/nickel transport system permease protein
VSGFLFRRTAQSLVALIVLVAAVFMLSRLTGDPANLYLPVNASESARAQFRATYGLDQPILVQFWEFLKGAVHLDFGNSTAQGVSAFELAMARVPATLRLASVTAIVVMVVSVVLGGAAALYPNGLVNRVQQFVALAGASLPDFWLGLMLIAVFSDWLGVLPTSGTGGLEHMVLPVLVLASRPIGVMSQVVRSALLEQLTAPYVASARGKGRSQLGVLVVHAWRNALVPIVAVGSDQLMQLVSGAVVVEVVFGWPGLGQLSIQAVTNRDFPVLQVTVILVAVMVFIVNFLADVAFAVIDPRIRYS